MKTGLTEAPRSGGERKSESEFNPPTAAAKTSSAVLRLISGGRISGGLIRNKTIWPNWSVNDPAVT